MNLSIHSFFPNKWRDGQVIYDGTFCSGYLTTALTRWFPVNTIGLCPFFIPSNASILYGGFYGYYVGGTTTGQYINVYNNTPLPRNVCITDGSSPDKSKQFSLILY